MTGLLEKALRRVETLSAEEQDAIASQIIETLDDEEAWATRFSHLPDAMRDLARAAKEEHRRGETRPLDETPPVRFYTTRGFREMGTANCRRNVQLSAMRAYRLFHQNR